MGKTPPFSAGLAYKANRVASLVGVLPGLVRMSCSKHRCTKLMVDVLYTMPNAVCSWACQIHLYHCFQPRFMITSNLCRRALVRATVRGRFHTQEAAATHTAAHGCTSVGKAPNIELHMTWGQNTAYHMTVQCAVWARHGTEAVMPAANEASHDAFLTCAS
jgi:hypothetical protein